jgi:hypothetical protein
MILPATITALDMAFPTNVNHLPPMDEVPDDFKNGMNSTVWHQAFNEWFYYGVARDQFKIKPGINEVDAFKHLSSVIGAYWPKHEHKEAGVAYLMSLWFDSFEPRMKNKLSDLL